MNEEERRSAVQLAYQMQDNLEGIYQGKPYTAQRTPDGQIVVTIAGKQGIGKDPNEALKNALNR